MIRISCKESGRLISQSMDRDLDLGQRVVLRLHLFVCTACSRVKTQFAFLHRAAREYPGPEGDDIPPKP